MKARIISTLIFALFAGSAFAGSFAPDNVNTNVNTPTAIASSAQGQLQGQFQGQVGIIDNDVRIRGLSSVSTGDTTLTVNEAPIPADTTSRVTQRGTVTIKNTPEITLSNIHPTAPCMGGTSVGGSGPGFSIGIGTSWTDKDCSLRETARSFAGMGLAEDALAVLCASEFAVSAPSCKALKAEEAK